MACSDTKTCTACKPGYFLSSGACLTCPSLPNCDTCYQFDAAQCIACSDGYYTDAGNCVQCPQIGCRTCTSSTTCTAPQNGYYLVTDITGAETGSTLKCDGLCATCEYSGLNCLTCQSGAKLLGTNCISNKNFAMSLVAAMGGLESGSSNDYELGLAISVSGRFLEELGVKVFKYPTFHDFQANSNIKSILHSSIVVSYDLNQAGLLVDPNTALKAASFTDVTILSQSITANSESSSAVNLGLVLGVSIPLGLLRTAPPI